MRKSVTPPIKGELRAPTDTRVLDAASASAAAVPALADGWTPTDRQRRAKSRLLIEMRHDPLLNPAALTGPVLAGLLGVSETWLREWQSAPQFRPWLLAKRESEEKAQYLLDSALDILGTRLLGMDDKNLINAAKLLADIAARQQEAAAPAEIDYSTQSPEQLLRLVAQLAPQLIPAAKVEPPSHNVGETANG